MNRFDGKSDTIETSMEEKAWNIARVVADENASLLVIQEAPGPQLREMMKESLKKKLAMEKAFTKKLKNAIDTQMSSCAGCWKFKQVELRNYCEIKKVEKGEDHIFGWNSNVLQLLQAGDLPAPIGKKWIARAPSWAEFKLLKPMSDTLLVISVHAKLLTARTGSLWTTKLKRQTTKKKRSKKKRLNQRRTPLKTQRMTLR